MKCSFIKHVVFSHYKRFRWYFIDTYTHKYYFISINPFDIKYIFNGISLLLPPLTKKHIKGWKSF
jgi:hypothetical protein